MRKNLLLAFSLIVLTFTIQGSKAREFQQPEWDNDYHVLSEKVEEGVRMPSSGTQKSAKENSEGLIEEENVESWKYEAPKE